MIYVENTPNNAGVYISGDLNDITRLCESIQSIVGEDGEFVGYEHIRLRFLEFCKGITKALHDEQKVVFLDNGIREVNGRGSGTSGTTLTSIHNQNVYYQIPVLWSDLLFITYVANDFIEMYAKNNKHYWDIIPASLRKFQGIIADHIEETIGEHKFRLLKSSLTPNFIGYYQNYAVQYIDQLALDYLKNEVEDRNAAVSILARRIAVKDGNYIKMKNKIEKLAIHQKIPINQVQLPTVDTQKMVW